MNYLSIFKVQIMFSTKGFKINAKNSFAPKDFSNQLMENLGELANRNRRLSNNQNQQGGKTQSFQDQMMNSLLDQAIVGVKKLPTMKNIEMKNEESKQEIEPKNEDIKQENVKRVIDYIHVVVDTNVWVHNIDDVKQLIFEQCYEHCVVYLPWKVYQELDGLKRSVDRSKAARARRAILYISYLKKEHQAKIRCQTNGQHYRMTKKFLSNEPDEIIIQTCRILQRQGKPTYIYTKDTNCENRASTQNVLNFPFIRKHFKVTGIAFQLPLSLQLNEIYASMDEIFRENYRKLLLAKIPLKAHYIKLSFEVAEAIWKLFFENVIDGIFLKKIHSNYNFPSWVEIRLPDGSTHSYVIILESNWIDFVNGNFTHKD